MMDSTFLQINNLVNETQIIPEKREALAKIVEPWIPAGSKVLARLVKSSLHAGDSTDYVVFTETALYIAFAEAGATSNFDYELTSIQCYAADNIVGYSFVLGSPQEIRLMLRDGKFIKLCLDVTLENSKILNPELLKTLAKSRFLTCNVLEICDA